jgi:hypothetical protein
MCIMNVFWSFLYARSSEISQHRFGRGKLRVLAIPFVESNQKRMKMLDCLPYKEREKAGLYRERE